MSYDISTKIIVIGDTCVGKTALVESLVEKKFDPGNCCPTIGVEFRTIITKIGNKRVKGLIWDTAGQESYRSLINGYYRGCAAAIIVFDVTNAESFRNVEYWREEMRKNNPGKKVAEVLVANKTDKRNRVVDKEAIDYYCRMNDITCFETSARKHQNIQEFFNYLMRTVLVNNIETVSSSPGITIMDEKPNDDSVTWCKCFS